MSISYVKDGTNPSKLPGNEKRPKRKTTGKTSETKEQPTHNNTLSVERCEFFIRLTCLKPQKLEIWREITCIYFNCIRV